MVGREGLESLTTTYQTISNLHKVRLIFVSLNCTSFNGKVKI